MFFTKNKEYHELEEAPVATINATESTVSSPPPSSSSKSLLSRLIQLPPDLPPPQSKNYYSLSCQTRIRKGEVRINTSLPEDPGVSDPIPPGETIRPNLMINYSCYSPMDALVWIEGKERAVLRCESIGGGDVLLQVVRELSPEQSFYIAVHSRSSYIEIKLPIDFRGPIRCKSGARKIKYVKDIRKRLTVLGQRDGMEHAFLGEFEGSGYEQIWSEGKGVWEGDEAEAMSSGGIWFGFGYHTAPSEKYVVERYGTGQFFA